MEGAPMTMKFPLTRGPLSRLPPAAVLLSMRQSLTPLSRAAFVRQLPLLAAPMATLCSDSSLAHPAETPAAN
jgi:hypothetical protein